MLIKVKKKARAFRLKNHYHQYYGHTNEYNTNRNFFNLIINDTTKNADSKHIC